MTDTSYNPGVQGQTRSTWRDPHHLRGLLVKLIKLHPDLDDGSKEFAELYLAEAKGSKFRASPQHEAFIDEALLAKLDNDRKMFHDRDKDKKKRPAKPTAADIAAADKRLKAIVLMELVTPIGKRLGDCNGRELRKIGGWFTQIADRIGDRGVVRKKLSEAELINIRDGITPPAE